MADKFEFDSPALGFTPKEKLPPKTPSQKVRGIFRKLSFYPELVKAFGEMKREDITPFEDTINLSEASLKDRNLLKQKNPALSLYIRLRSLFKRITKRPGIGRKS